MFLPESRMLLAQSRTLLRSDRSRLAVLINAPGTSTLHTAIQHDTHVPLLHHYWLHPRTSNGLMLPTSATPEPLLPC